MWWAGANTVMAMILAIIECKRRGGQPMLSACGEEDIGSRRMSFCAVYRPHNLMIDDLSVICTDVYDELSQNYIKQISPVQPQPGVNK